MLFWFPQQFQAFETPTTLAFACVRATATADGGTPTGHDPSALGMQSIDTHTRRDV